MKCTQHTDGEFIKKEDSYSLFCTEGIKEMESHKTNGTLCQQEREEEYGAVSKVSME